MAYDKVPKAKVKELTAKAKALADTLGSLLDMMNDDEKPMSVVEFQLREFNRLSVPQIESITAHLEQLVGYWQLCPPKERGKQPPKGWKERLAKN